jgi:zinc transporter ZupT
LRDAGYTTWGALGINFLVSSTILIGAIGGYFLLETFEMLEGPLLGLAAGGILVVVLHDLIPHSIRESITTMHYAKHILCFLMGGVLMFSVTTLVAHEHEHEHVEEGGHSHEHEEGHTEELHLH